MTNELQIIVQESGLDKVKQDYIIVNFENYFSVAKEWKKKAESIIVNDESQKEEMQIARVGRLFLQKKRTAIEEARKQLKQQSLNEGRAIDNIAKELTKLIKPIEEYLEKQEKFVEIKEYEKKEAIRIEIEKKLEEERIAKEKLEAEERERIKIENDRLKKEAQQRELQIAEERKKLEEEKRAIEEKSRIERELQELNLIKEREQKEFAIKQEREKSEQEARKIKAENDAKLKEEQEKLRIAEGERERVKKILENQITCPHCGNKLIKDGCKL